MIPAEERTKILSVPLCGERVLKRLESIGVCSLAAVKGRDPWDLMSEINLEASRAIWHPPMAVQALQNLVDAAERETGG
jgi:hypothetical protein